jgi:SAM-dependent methyltransferase
VTPERRQLLADCARLALELAPETCHSDDASGESCAWYHGFWPVLRLLDYGSSPELHADFYRAGLAPLAASSAAPRILISGAADFAMLEVARSAFAGAAAQPDFTATDICETPLALSRWFAAREGFELATRASDILTFDDREGFDAIVTHSFLGNFAAEQRPALMRQWYRLLKPGGRLLTINRLRGATAAKTTAFTEAEATRFVQRLRADLEAHRDEIDCPPETLAAMAEAYLRNRRSHPVRTREELAGYFEGAGFTLEHFAELGVPDPGGSRPAGPTMPGGGRYMTVIARRPA